MSNTQVADQQLMSNGNKNVPEANKLASKQNTTTTTNSAREGLKNGSTKKANNLEQVIGSEASAESSASSWNGNNSNGSANNKGLSLVLPQVHKSSLVTPTIGLSSAGEQPVTSLFSSLIPFNVQEAGRFTGLPSFTPTSADALASSNLSAVNPFFRNITFSNHTGGSGGEIGTDQLVFYQHQNEPDERNGYGEIERQAAPNLNPSSSPSPNPNPNHNLNAANGQSQHKERRQRLSKLSLDQAVAANAFGQPFLTSPLLLLSPDQEHWLRQSLATPGQPAGGLDEPASTLAYQQTQQHHRLVSAAVAAANSQDLSNQIAAHRNGFLIASANSNHLAPSGPYLAHAIPASSQYSPGGAKSLSDAQPCANYQTVTGNHSNGGLICGGVEIAGMQSAQQVLNSLQQSPTNQHQHQHQYLYKFQSGAKSSECAPTLGPTSQQAPTQQLDTNHLSVPSQWATGANRGQPLAGPPVAHLNSQQVNKLQPTNLLVLSSDGANRIDPKVVEFHRQQQYLHQEGQVMFVANHHHHDQQQQQQQQQQQLQRTPFHCDASQQVGICEPHLRQLYLTQQHNNQHPQQSVHQRHLLANGQELYMRAAPTQSYQVQHHHQQQQANSANHNQTLPTGENNLPAGEAVYDSSLAEVNQRKLSEGQSVCQLGAEKQLSASSPKESASRANSLIDSANESSSHQSLSCATNSSPSRSSISREITTVIDASSSLSPSQQQRKLGHRNRLIVAPAKRSIASSKTKGSNSTSMEQRLNQLKQTDKRTSSIKEPDSSKDQNGDVVVKKKSKGGRKKKQVTHEELMARKNRSKERNRVAAKRCRQKRKQFLDELRGRIDALNDSNRRLQKENSSLKSELDQIKQIHKNCR